MKRMLFVLNPAAGMRKANRFLADMVAVFNRADYEVQVFVTGGRGEAVDAVARQAESMDLVVCCGGDGTFNETVSGILKSGSNTPVGYIPAGSTNDFANSLHLSNNFLEAAKQIVAGTPCQYDIGQFDQRYFSYVASFGAFTRASYSTPQSIKNALGHAAYVLEGIQELSQIKSVHVKLELDGEAVEDEYLFGAICNSTSVGGILTLDPKQVDMGDGRFEVMLVRKPRDLSEIAECIQAVQKQQYNCKMMTFRSTKTVRVYTDAPLAWTLDGEQAGMDGQVLIENLHHAITLIK